MDSLVNIIHWSRTLCLWDPFSDIWQCLWHPEPFHAFRIGCFAKTLNGWLLGLLNFAGWLCPTCVTGTWVTSWIDVILIWYHYIVICTLVTIFNWWLSSKDIKLWVLIKEVLVVFHWLTFRIILLCSLVWEDIEQCFWYKREFKNHYISSQSCHIYMKIQSVINLIIYFSSQPIESCQLSFRQTCPVVASRA